MSMLAIYPRFNTLGRSDASGAFHPAAREFLQVHHVPVDADHVLVFDNTVSLAARRKNLTRSLRDARKDLRTIAFFCHGWKDGIQCGFTSKEIPAFAELLDRVSGGKLERVVLYACDNGRDADNDRQDDLKDTVGGDGGFADLLRDEFGRLDRLVTVFAHAKEGHTTQNPFVRKFQPEKVFGGEFVVHPQSVLWPVWRRALAGTDLWARFPFMSVPELLAELSGGARVG